MLEKGVGSFVELSVIRCADSCGCEPDCECADPGTGGDDCVCEDF